METTLFRASRLTRGNHLFPAEVEISATSITLRHKRWFGKTEESIHLAHVASITIDTHLIFADVTIESSGGQDPIFCHGHTKSDAIEMKQLIEDLQSGFYKPKS